MLFMIEYELSSPEWAKPDSAIASQIEKQGDTYKCSMSDYLKSSLIIVILSQIRICDDLF